MAKMTCELYNTFGKIVRLTGLIGRPDLLFVNDADEIEKVRFGSQVVIIDGL